MKKNLILFFIVSLAIPCTTFAATAKPGWRKSFILGYGITNTDQTQIVHNADTPLPGLDNSYVGSSKLYGSVLLGLALEKECQTSFKNIFTTAGFEFDYLRNMAVNGIVEPMVNIAPNFDFLKYSYDIHSLVFQGTAKLTRQEILQHVDGYLQAGLGAAIDRLSDYREYSPDGSSAAPMLSPYGNRDTLSPALSAGFGASYNIGLPDTYLSFGYRYFYTGRGRLNKSPVQETNASITLSSINYHFLVLSLSM